MAGVEGVKALVQAAAPAAEKAAAKPGGVPSALQAFSPGARAHYDKLIAQGKSPADALSLVSRLGC